MKKTGKVPRNSQIKCVMLTKQQCNDNQVKMYYYCCGKLFLWLNCILKLFQIFARYHLMMCSHTIISLDKCFVKKILKRELHL